MKKHTFHIIICILLFSFTSVVSQTRSQLEAQRKLLKKEIKQVNSLLFKEQKKEQNALEALKDINKKIAVRNKLISTINLEANLLNKAIKRNQKQQKALQKKLTDLKAAYSAIIFKAYKSKSKQSRAMFLLSSQNFHQAYKRLQYLKQYTSFRKKQGEEIVLQTNLVKKLKDSLLKQKKLKDALISNQKEEKVKIESDKKQQERLIFEIKKQENKYKKALKAKIAEEKKVVKKIDRIIRNAIAKANKNVKNTFKKAKKNEFILSPEAKVLAANFKANKGKLPWPVKEGLVVRRFGKQAHPTFPGITVNGTGLHIVTNKTNNANAIFNGEVLNVLKNSQGRKNILIRHGNYISSYNNLEKVFVKKGDKVKTKQEIGTIFTDKVSGKTKLIFVLFKNTERLNPSTWILKQ